MEREQNDSEALCALSCYTLSHKGSEFIHQHVVDASGAQNATANDRRISLVFALIGLYLHIEKQYTGKEIQIVHRELADRNPYKHPWPTVSFPENRGAITVHEVLAVPEGAERDSMIDSWCASVWEAFSANRPVIVNLLSDYQII